MQFDLCHFFFQAVNLSEQGGKVLAELRAFGFELVSGSTELPACSSVPLVEDEGGGARAREREKEKEREKEREREAGRQGERKLPDCFHASGVLVAEQQLIGLLHLEDVELGRLRAGRVEQRCEEQRHQDSGFRRFWAQRQETGSETPSGMGLQVRPGARDREWSIPGYR